ncbi:MAG: hypothetical protein MUO51_00035 [Woeseiaceae bacterium]|nr:hypothetical protein [Woeseiaceae bacterium]
MAYFAARLRPLGPFNFVYSDSDALFVHSHRRTQSDGKVRPPGLHMLVRSCNEQAINLTQSGVLLAPLAQELVLVASVNTWRKPVSRRRGSESMMSLSLLSSQVSGDKPRKVQ